MTTTERVYAEDRAETDACERGTPGCAIDHTAERDAGAVADTPCATW